MLCYEVCDGTICTARKKEWSERSTPSLPLATWPPVVKPPPARQPPSAFVGWEKKTVSNMSRTSINQKNQMPDISKIPETNTSTTSNVKYVHDED